MAREQEKRQPRPVAEENLAQAQYHLVSEVCRNLGVEPHVLRYWEKEFELTVKRNSAGRRMYSEDQVEKLRTIKHLLRRERLTVKGARSRLARMKDVPPDAERGMSRQNILWLKKELIAIKGMLETDARA